MKWAIILLIVFLFTGGSSYVTARRDTGPYHEIQTLGRGMVRCAAWSPDGTTITATGAIIAVLPGPSNAAVWNGTQLAVAQRDGTIRIWGE